MTYALGVLVSLVVQAIKEYFGTTTFGTYLALAAVSVVFGGIYVVLVNTSYWSTITEVITAAAAFHNLVIRRLEK